MDNSTVIKGTNIFTIKFFQTGKVFLNEPDNCPYMTLCREKLQQKTKESLTKFMKEFD